jgi:L-Ala-D/L-Glu epimerase
MFDCIVEPLMQRRTFASLLAANAAPAAAPSWDAKVVRLNLRDQWTTVMSSSAYRDNLHLTLRRDGITARGEAAPIVRYKENAELAKQAVDAVAPALMKADWRQYRKTLDMVFARMEGNYAARAAIDMAVMDFVGQKMGVPLWQLFGLDPADAPITTFSIGIDDPKNTRRKVEAAAAFPVLKIKVGLDSDEATMEAVRAVTNKPLRVDANEGWKDRETALRKIRWLETQNVEFIEQPLPASMIDDIRWLRGKVNMPIIADEACLHPEDIPSLADAYDGINIKLMKAGGILAGLKMIDIARSLKLKVMLGCMIESSIACTAAAHISPLVDYADLDGNLLIGNDPVRGVTVKDGRLVLPRGPGLGLMAK